MSTIESPVFRPPVEATLSAHFDEANSITNVRTFCANVKTHLDDRPPSRALIVTENPILSIEQSRNIFTRTTQGVPFSDASLPYDYEFEMSRHPGVNITFEEYKRLARKKTYTRTWHDLFDSLIEGNKGRVGVLTEGVDDALLERNKKVVDTLDDYSNNLLPNLSNLHIEEALDIFKRYVLSMSGVYSERDTNLVMRIEEASNEFRPDMIFILFGAVHTKLVHLLRRTGFPTVRTFGADAKPNRYFEPSYSMLRKLAFRPSYQPTETEWIRTMISELIYIALRYSRKERELADKVSIRMTQDLDDSEVMRYYQILKQSGHNKLYDCVIRDLINA